MMQDKKIREQLKELIGHEIFVDTLMPEDKDIPGGILKEVGIDYLVIDTREAEKTGDVEAAADWFVRLEMVVSIGHPYDCPRCAIDAATKQA
jgi:hypothetical protein